VTGTGDEGLLWFLLGLLAILLGEMEGHPWDDGEMVSVLFGELSGEQFDGVSGMDLDGQEVTGQEFDTQGECLRGFGSRMEVSNGMSFLLIETFLAILLLALFGPYLLHLLVGMTSRFQFDLEDGETVMCLLETTTKGANPFLHLIEFLLSPFETMTSGFDTTQFGACGTASNGETEFSGLMSGSCLQDTALDASGLFFVTVDSFLNGLESGLLDGNPTSGLCDRFFGGRRGDDVHGILLGVFGVRVRVLFGVSVRDILIGVRDILGILGEVQGIQGIRDLLGQRDFLGNGGGNGDSGGNGGNSRHGVRVVGKSVIAMGSNECGLDKR